jgi:histidine ammonia-lyase
MSETQLEMAIRHVADQEVRIAKQRALIARMEAHGLPIHQAQDLLGKMVAMLGEMREHRDFFSSSSRH